MACIGDTLIELLVGPQHTLRECEYCGDFHLRQYCPWVELEKRHETRYTHSARTQRPNLIPTGNSD